MERDSHTALSGCSAGILLLAGCLSAYAAAEGPSRPLVTPPPAADPHAAIEREVARSDARIGEAQAALRDSVSLAAYRSRVRTAGGTNVWTDALQAAVDAHEIVIIPAAATPYYIDRPVRVPSNRRIEATGATVALLPGTRTLMLCNRSAADGTLAPLRADGRDDNIAIVGGRWEDWMRSRAGYGTTARFNLGERRTGNFYGVSALFYFGNCNRFSVKGVTFAHASGFAVQCGDGDGRLFEDIVFDDCSADGLHLNGNLTRVHAKNVRGKVGDDLVALNAYDWLDSSVNFGPQRYILCEDLELRLKDGKGYPAIRILPAKYRYADGSVVDCAISDVIIRRVKGIVTYKMYLQTPRYRIGEKPEWGEVGSGGNLYFEDLAIDLDRPIDRIGQYETSDPVRGHFAAFEFGANLSSVTFRNIDITFHLDKYPLSHLATVGPKSIRLKAKDGADWEIFDPYVNCEVGTVTLENIRCHGAKPAELVHATAFDNVNGDGRSTGAGRVNRLVGAGASASFSLREGEVKVLDFGPDGVGGYPSVAFEAAENARVRLSYASHPDGLGEKGDFWHETRANYMGWDVWLPILPANTDRFDVFEQNGAGTWRAPLAQGLLRYVRVAVERGSVRIGEVRLVNDGIHSEEPVVGSFSCSDELVNKAWRASVRTCQMAAIPARTKPLAVRGVHTNAVLGTTYAYLSDGAKRDRLVWSGDLWFAQRNMYAAFPWDSPYMPGSVRMLAENHTPEGYVQACPYPESHRPLKVGEYGPFASDEFAAWFVPVVWDHILHTADRKLAEETLPVVKGLVGYLDSHTGADGVFVQRQATSKFSCGLAVGGVSPDQRAYMNILLWLAYRDAAALADWLGDRAFAAQAAALADRMAKVVRANFWNAEKGHFVFARTNRRFCFEGSAFALACRFATRDEAARILPQLKRVNHGKFQLLAVRGAFEYGAAEKAMELVRAHNWFRYFDPSWKGLHTVYECATMMTKGWTDEAHPDACIAGVFTNYLLGIEPVEPGYRRFRVRPQPTKTVTSADGSVSTPSGPIRVAWRLENGKVALEVRAPENLTRVE